MDVYNMTAHMVPLQLLMQINSMSKHSRGRFGSQIFLFPKKILTEALREFIVIPITNNILLPLVLKYGVLPLAGWQVAAKAALSLSFLSRTHDRKYNERLVD